MPRSKKLRFAVLFVLLSVAAACRGRPPGDDVVSVRGALSDEARVLDFESPADWSAPAAALGSSTRHVSGEKSLSVAGGGWIEIQSVPLATVRQVGAAVEVDVLLPTTQTNPWWLGAIQLYVEVPGRNVFNRFIAQRELTGLALDTFNRLSFPVPADVAAALAEPMGHVRVKVVLNVPQGNGAYLLDRLTFGPPPGGGGGGAGGGSGVEIVESQLAELPPAIHPADVALHALRSLVVSDRAVVRGPDGAPALIANSGTGPTQIGVDARVGSVWSRGPVTLQERASVRGFLATGATLTRQNGTSVLGQIREQVPSSVGTSVWKVATQAGATDVIVGAGQQRVLAPGSYRAVSVASSSSLTLGAGTFHFDRLLLEPSAQLISDNAAGVVKIVVRGELSLRGRLTSTSPRPANTLVNYLGTATVPVEGPFLGTLIAPNARLVLAAIPGGFHAGSFVGLDIEVQPQAQVFLRSMELPSSENWPEISVLRDVPGASTVTFRSELTSLNESPEKIQQWLDDYLQSGQPGPEMGATRPRPIVVARDNPSFFGKFASVAGESWTALGNYGHGGTWSGGLDGRLIIRQFLPGSDAEILFTNFAPLLPYKTAAFPQDAQWLTKTARLHHGAQFELSRIIIGPNPLGVGRTLWVELSEGTLVVPVFVVSFVWNAPDAPAPESQDLSDKTRALIDFIPSSIFPLPNGTPLDPNGDETPPDDIWAQCGIQFQVIRTTVMDLPVGWQPQCNRSGAQEFRNIGEVRAAFEASSDAASAARIFDRLAPVFLQYGALPGCPFDGSTLPGQHIAQVRTVARLSDDGTLTAHELGHVLLGRGHFGLSGSGNLMAEAAGSTDIELTSEQCHEARSAAKAFSDRYRAYNIEVGRAAAAPVPPIPPPEFDPTLNTGVPVDLGQQGSELLASVCCEAGGEISRTRRAGCYASGGSEVDANRCLVCCAVTESPPVVDRRDIGLCSNVATSPSGLDPCAFVACAPDTDCSLRTVTRYACEKENKTYVECLPH